jgi:hypothetical protein
MVLRIICGQKGEEVIGSWSNFHNEELRNL